MIVRNKTPARGSWIGLPTMNGIIRPLGPRAVVVTALVGTLAACMGKAAPMPSQSGAGGGAMTGADGGPPAAMTGAIGPTPLRRLTHDQYDNAVRDLLAIARAPSIQFSADEGDAGFDANARIPLASLQLDEYRRAATDLATRAVAAGLGTLAPCAAGADEIQCGADFVAGFGKRVFRRPLTSAEAGRYTKLFGAERTARGYGSGVALVIRAMLQSPNFLYRIEVGRPASAEKDGGIPLTGYELASRLSFFLWNGIPDPNLLALAEADKLRTADQVAAVARQMLRDPRARQMVASFHQQWMEIAGLATATRSDPAFTADLRAAMADEFLAFSDGVLRQGDGRLETLLTASFTFARGPLFGLYGLPAPADPGQSVRVDLPAVQPRAGILTLPAVMATHAHPDQTSPVHRGLLVRSRLLCTVLPPPPPGVDNTPPPVDPNVSARKRFEQHRADPACKSCHSLMDPLGVTFEMFDAIGRFRTTDGNQPVDSASALTGTMNNDGPANDPLALARRLAAAPEVRDCVARQWFRYLSGRGESDLDAPAIGAAVEAMKQSESAIPELLVAFTRTRSFLYLLPAE
jgi:hypothetical protein